MRDGSVGPDRAGSFHISTIWVKTNTFCSMNHISKMFRFRDTKNSGNLIWAKFAPLSSLRSIRFARNQITQDECGNGRAVSVALERVVTNDSVPKSTSQSGATKASNINT